MYWPYEGNTVQDMGESVFLPSIFGIVVVHITNDMAYDMPGYIRLRDTLTAELYDIPGFIKDGRFHPDTSYLQMLASAVLKQLESAETVNF